MVVGQGTRLFPDTGPDTALELVEIASTPTGVTIGVYWGLPAHRAPAVRNRHDRHEARDIAGSSKGPDDRSD